MDDRKNVISNSLPFLDSNGNAQINLDVKLSMWVKVLCLIDTGFSGGLALPKYYQNFFDNKIPLYSLQFEYANGSTEMVPIYPVRIKAMNKAYDTRLMFCNGSSALVGMKFLRDYYMRMNIQSSQISLEWLGIT